MKQTYHRQIVLTMEVENLFDEDSLEEVKNEIAAVVEKHREQHDTIKNVHIRVN